MPTRTNPYLSLILACYNESEHLELSLKRIYSVLYRLKKPCQIIFVDDKSKDKTLTMIRKLIKIYKKKNPEIKLITHAQNLGRGRSVMDGFRVAGGRSIGFLDADLEVGPEYIPQALELLKKYDLVVGRREFPFSLKTIHRYFASKVYAWLAKSILDLPVTDSEAGFKFFNRDKIAKVFPYVKNNGWFWDTEIIALAKLFGLKIKELPVRYIRRKDKTSTVNTLNDSFEYLFNLIVFRLRLNTIKSKS